MGILLRLFSLVALLPAVAFADSKLPWEHWARYCYPPELSTEWFVAEDHSPVGGPNVPENFVVHTLVQPRVTKIGHQWEITFDPATKKKPMLNSHFDNAKASDPVPGGFRINPQSERYWYDMAQRPPNFWLILKSREYLDGKFTPLNYDPDHTGKPTQYTLIPANAVLTSFYEPLVTPQEDEWAISFAKITPEQRNHLTTYAADWLKHHPGPKLPPAPPIRYSATMQKQYDAWWKALKAWQQAGSHGLSPRLVDDFFKFTPEQARQYAAWEKARALWYATGQGSFPQPIDFLPELPATR